MNYLFTITSVWILFIPFIFNGSLNVYGNFVVMISGLIILAIFSFRSSHLPVRKTLVNIVFSLFVLFIIFSSFFSLVISRSISESLWWLAYLIFFLIFQTIVKDRIRLIFLSKSLIILSSVFAILSIGQFMGDDSVYKLQGLIGQYSIYAGFLIIPFVLNLYFIFREGKVLQRRFWYITSIILLTGLILTFSWSAWFSIIFAIAITFIIFRKEIGKRIGEKGSIKILKSAGVLVLISILVSFFIWYIANRQIYNPNQSFSSRTELIEKANKDSLLIRLRYFSSAWKTFIHSPIIGFGSGMYIEAIRLHEDDPAYSQTSGSQTWISKILVENGIIAVFIFIVFLVILFKDIIKKINKNRETWLSVCILVAFIASTIHSLIERGWTNPYLLLIFFVFAGVLYGYLTHSNSRDDSYLIFGSWFNYILLILMIIGSIVSIQVLRADLDREKGDRIFIETKSIEYASKKYLESVAHNPRDPLTWYNLWKINFASGNYDLAYTYIKKAVEIFPENKTYSDALTLTEKEM